MAAERVLIVEDDPEVREMMGEYLETHGYQVTLCANGEAMRMAFAESVRPGLASSGAPPDEGPRDVLIGRASCRERVLRLV